MGACGDQEILMSLFLAKTPFLRCFAILFRAKQRGNSVFAKKMFISDFLISTSPHKVGICTSREVGWFRGNG